MTETYKEYINAGKKLTPLNGKIPILRNWVSIEMDIEDIEDHVEEQGNLGWVLGSTDLVVDVDPKNGGDESFRKLERDLNVVIEPTVRTPSGGFHCYMKIPPVYVGKSFKKTFNKEYPGIDFLTEGSQCVIVGSVTEKGSYEWYDDLFPEFEQTLAPVKLMELIAHGHDKVMGGALSQEDEELERMIGGNAYGWDRPKVEALLEKLDPSMTNSDWVRVGMALQDWNYSDGLKLWEEWSKGGDNYVEGETEKRWKSFKLGGGVTLGTISYMAKEVDFDTVESKVQSYKDSIKLADRKKIEFDIIPKLKNEDFDSYSSEIIVKAVQDRLKELSGVRIPIKDVRSKINPVVSGQFVEDVDIPEWCKDWIYVNSHTGFMNMKTLKVHKAESFNQENGIHVPRLDSGSKLSASKYTADNGLLKKVDAIAYLPTIKDEMCTIDGTTYINSFSHSSLPLPADDYTEDGWKAIERIKRHIKFICTTDENAEVLTEWLAHNIQFPGRKILWSPVIQSVEGAGKSFFGEFLRVCLGDRNVGTISPTQVTSDFNGWATGVCVNSLEELRVKGHNRYEAVNALKPLITDRVIQINEKGVKQVMVPNTTNYIAFTNFKDALPLGMDDRRWWVIFVPVDSLDDVTDMVGEYYADYFADLYECLRLHGDQVLKWISNYCISKEFMNMKKAPMTTDKLAMIATEENGIEGLTESRQLLVKGGKFYNKNVVCSDEFFTDLLFENPDLDVHINNRSKGDIMKRMNFLRHAKVVKLYGKTRRVWTKRPMKNAEIRKELYGIYENDEF